jgi:tetratricopeptide (TPR) repeat protein
MYRAIRLGELATIRAAGLNWRPVRRELGITGFGINAYTGSAGEALIESHDETGSGAAGHQELYVVLSGHAKFVVDSDEIDAPAVTLVFVPDIKARREATSLAQGTTVLVIGGPPGAISPSPWEHFFAASPAAAAGDPARAYEIASEGLSTHPDNASLHYNLACFAALAGESDRAIEHLSRALDSDPRISQWAATDGDLDAIRSDPRYPAKANHQHS